MSEPRWDIFEVASMLDRNPGTIRYHIRKGDITPKREKELGKWKYYFSPMDYLRLKDLFEKED